MSSELTVLNYMPLVVSSEFGKRPQFIIPVNTISIYTPQKNQRTSTYVFSLFNTESLIFKTENIF